MPSRPIGRGMQKRVIERLWQIYQDEKTWEGVHQKTGINKGQANAVANKKKPPSWRMVELLLPPAVRKRRKPWKKKHYFLRKAIETGFIHRGCG